jgi:hypothetical protein
MLLLGAPPAALAQSAGDEQYQDPLPGGSSGGSGSSGGNSGTNAPSSGGSSGSTAPSTGTSGTGTAPAPTTAAPTTSTGATEGTAAAPGELPRTGGDPLIIAMFGGSLLLLGGGMRLAVPRRD